MSEDRALEEEPDPELRAEEFRVVHYDTPVGNAAAYYPETNVLVPLDSTADGSGTPTSKSVIVRIERRTAGTPALRNGQPGS